ncbi:hypothetical protein BBJ28_00002753 [Nothophytophthora sp. Chile5]|nr:hypothetical protein BBJ28_00002753 [Nothophytophthora sp. Chile5]
MPPEEVLPTKTPGESLLKLAMEAQPVANVREKETTVAVKGSEAGDSGGLIQSNDDSNSSPAKTRALQSIRGDQQSEDTVAASMLPDVSYSMRATPRLGNLLHSEASSQPTPSPNMDEVDTEHRSRLGIAHLKWPVERYHVVWLPQGVDAAGLCIDDDDDDDDDLEEDDEEATDWDLGDEDKAESAVSTSKPPNNSNPIQGKDPHSSQAQHVHSSPTKSDQPPSSPFYGGSSPQQQQKPSPHTSAISPYPPPSRPRRSSGFQSKFRSAFELTDDTEIVQSDSDESSTDSDEDDVSGSGDGVEDWLDDSTDPAPAGSPSIVASLKKPAAVLSSRQDVLPASAASSPPRRPSARHLYGLSIIPPVNGSSPVHANDGGPTSGSPQQPPMRHQGNMSPLRSAGAIMHAIPAGSPSPVKQPSYRSSIVTNASPANLSVPIGDRSPIKSAPSPSSSAAAAIRDTNIVKRKKAELPQRNLPHPTPKFGDWLNSRTMINNYIILETLGTGGYAEVKLCKEKHSSKLFAMKFINRDVMKKDKLGKQSKLDDIKREIAIMKKLNHPNVLRLYEVMDDPKMNKLFLVLEYMKYGDMLTYQKKKHPQGMLENLRDRDLHSIFVQVILGLAYLHEQKIVHGDIKPQNLLVGEKDVVKIADFGISQSLYGSKQKIMDTAGTPAFMSPEMCSGEEYSGQLADIWALGATIFMLKFGNPPFVAKSAMQMFERIQHDPLVFPSAIDPLLAHLLHGMLTKIPQKRLTLLEVMTHPWVTKDEKHSTRLELLQNPAAQITVSKDEIEHAMDATDHVAIIVNIRKQMLKRLKQARATLAAQERDGSKVAMVQATSGGHNEVQDDAFATRSKFTSPMNSARTKANKVFATNSVTGSNAEQEPPPREHQMLSNEEINYRSQLFSRKKPSNKNALETPAASGPTANLNSNGRYPAQGGGVVETEQSQLSNRLLVSNASLNDGENLSDDEDDELAVSQSPQLLDELLLTTLSMPPLAKTTGTKDTASHIPNRNAASASNSAAMGSLTANTAGRNSHDCSDEERFYGESGALGVCYGVSSLQGRRSTQEDRWVVFPEVAAALDYAEAPPAPWSTQSAYVGLYDGHGGEECANILHEQLHTWIFRSPEAPALTCKDLQDCFEALDSSVCDYLLHKDDLSGSTATGVVLRPMADGKLLLTIAHVGDCRLVLSKRDGTTVDLTRDHRLTLEAERERVLQLGGRVVNNRVNGVMAITRAFGDLEFKGLLGRSSGDSSNAFSAFGQFSRASSREDEKVPALLTARPDVHDLELDPREDDFLVLACDGLWDVLTSEEATSILRDRMAFHGDLQLAAHELAQEGIRRYSNDNITVIVVLLQPPVAT